MTKTRYDQCPVFGGLTPKKADGFERRHFLLASLAAGFAFAARPSLAAAIHTDSDGLVAAEVKVPIPGGEIPAYCAYPAKGGPFSTVLVAHELFGLNGYAQDIVRRLAKLGYFAICPNLFSRQADVGKIGSMMDIMATVVSKLVDAQILSDLDSTVAYAKKTGKANVERLGIVGFDWGGRAVWLYAAHNPKLKAGVSWYGFLGAPRDPNGHSAISLAAGIKPPVLGLYAAKDDYIMASDVEMMKASLKGSKSEIVVFPGVSHGFHDDDRPSFDAKAADDGWQHMRAWLRSNGVT
jgi:carboxymethylenebutenolidase